MNPLVRAECNYSIEIECEVAENSGRVGETKCNHRPGIELASFVLPKKDCTHPTALMELTCCHEAQRNTGRV